MNEFNLFACHVLGNSLDIANQKSVRYSFSKSYFTNIEFQNVNKAFVYTTDCNPSLKKTLIYWLLP